MLCLLSCARAIACKELSFCPAQVYGIMRGSLLQAFMQPSVLVVAREQENADDLMVLLAGACDVLTRRPC